MARLEQIAAQIAALWGRLGARTRTLAVAVVGLGLVAAIVVAVVAREPKRVLFSGLDPRDAAAVVGALDGAKIPYELDAGGTVVRVASGDVDQARLLLAEQDLPRTGNVGFELFEEQSFGLTDFAQKVNYRRALQGELERTISRIDSIGSARVHITQPDKAVFEDEKIPPTASVTVDLVAGRELQPSRVRAIRHLVASAVEGLEPSGVTVVDTEGNLLSRGGVGEDTAASALDYESRLEHELEQRVSRMLQRTVGVGGAEVRVAAEVDFSRTDTTEEVFDPEQTAVRTEALQEVHDGQAAVPGGVAGAPANTPGAATAQSAQGRGGSSKLVRSKSYEVNRTVVRTVGPEATLERLTVAVLVDGTYTRPEDGSDPVFAPRSEEELASLRSVVESAVGFDATRGDRIEIESVPFRDRPATGDDMPPPEPMFPRWLPYAAGGGVLAATVIAWLVFARRRRKTRVVEPELLAFPATVTQAQQAIARAEQPHPAAIPGQAALPAAAAPAIPGRDDIMALAAAEPERTADIIRSWITADRA